MKPAKPLGHRAYGSIPHLPGSRTGPADHCCHDGQARICTERTRDRHDRVIVQEKLDGSCVSVAKVGGEIVALGRAGYPASTSPHEQHHMFAAWVERKAQEFDGLLVEGERAVGEWLAQAHGTRYFHVLEPFVLFDLMTGLERVSHAELQDRNCGLFPTPHVLACEPTSAAEALDRLGPHGFYGARDLPEGAVWRVERKGKVDFLAKYVRHDKVDGAFLPEVSGKPPVWNWLERDAA